MNVGSVRLSAYIGIFALAICLAVSIPCRADTADTNRTGSNAPAELDLESYKRELLRISLALHNPKEISDLRRSLPESWNVRDGDRIYSVSTTNISDALRQIEHNPKSAAAAELQSRINAMGQQAQQLSERPPIADSANAQLKLKQILARGEFQAAPGPSTWDLIRARINRWILEHLLKLFSLLHISQRTGNMIAWGAIFLAVVLAFYVLYRWLTKSSKPVSFHPEVEPAASDTRHWLDEAFAAANRHDYREAIHCAYWASVAHLEDIRLLPRDRSRTPRESLRLLDQHPNQHGLLQTITRSFELVWYGYRPVSAVEWAGAKEQLEKIGCLPSTAPTVPS
jgi:Domain of unknown function (DUF4129)